MARYATKEEKITCKNCMVEFTERELVEGNWCPRCDKHPFSGLSLNVLQEAFRRRGGTLRLDD